MVQLNNAYRQGFMRYSVIKFHQISRFLVQLNVAQSYSVALIVFIKINDPGGCYEDPDDL